MFLFRTRAFELIPAASHTILDRTQDGSAEKNSRWGKKKKKLLENSFKFRTVWMLNVSWIKVSNLWSFFSKHFPLSPTICENGGSQAHHTFFCLASSYSKKKGRPLSPTSMQSCTLTPKHSLIFSPQWIVKDSSSWLYSMTHSFWGLQQSRPLPCVHLCVFETDFFVLNLACACPECCHVSYSDNYGGKS